MSVLDQIRAATSGPGWSDEGESVEYDLRRRLTTRHVVIDVEAVLTLSGRFHHAWVTRREPLLSNAPFADARFTTLPALLDYLAKEL